MGCRAAPRHPLGDIPDQPPIRPELALVMLRTGSIASTVGPAVIGARVPASTFGWRDAVRGNPGDVALRRSTSADSSQAPPTGDIVREAFWSMRIHLHHCCSHGTPSLLPSIFVPGQFCRKNVASRHDVICEQ